MERQHLSQTKNTIASSNRESAIARSSTHPVEELQGAIGNRAVNKLLANQPTLQAKPMFAGLSRELVVIQPKLAIGAVGDKYEQEADRVAADVVQRINQPEVVAPLQRETVQRQELPEEEELQMKPLVQRRGAIAGGEASTDLASAINSARGGGQPLDAGLQRSMGQAMGAKFSGVRVHADAESDRLNRSIQAKAFTTGQDVFFRQGAYQPGSRGGQELIAHELTHVVQQTGDQIRGQEHQKNNGPNHLDMSSARNNRIQRKFGFEIEIPIFTTFHDNRNGQDYWTDAGAGPGGITIGHPADIFDIHVDHNIELDQLSQHEETTSGLGDLFPHHASIIEVVTKAWDEQVLTRKNVKDYAKIITDYIKRVKRASTGGKVLLDRGIHGDYWIGSDMPGADALQSTLGYFQATYGVKVSKVPKLLKATTKPNSRVKDHQFLTGGVAAANRIIGILNWRTIPDAEVKQFKGLLALLCNYLIVGQDTSRIGLAKNTIGEYFYKSDLVSLMNTLPASIKAKTSTRALRRPIIQTILAETGCGENDPVLSGIGITCKKWLHSVLKGDTTLPDKLLHSMKNPYSQVLGPEPVGRAGAEQTGVIVENRELQYLDPNYAKRNRRYERQKRDLFAGPKLTQAQLAQALATLDDPKKYPIEDWERIMLLVYDMLRSINR
jgi:hypothetical protein